MRDITWPVPVTLCKIWVHIWFSHPHIAYSLWHFYWAPMKNKGCLLVRSPMLNIKSSENVLSPNQNWANFGSFGGLGVRGFKKLRFLLQNAHVCVNQRRLSHFASKLAQGCDLHVGEKKESHRDSHRKDMSPLTQGLNYRSAYDRQQSVRILARSCRLHIHHCHFPSLRLQWYGVHAADYIRLIYASVYSSQLSQIA